MLKIMDEMLGIRGSRSVEILELLLRRRIRCENILMIRRVENKNFHDGEQANSNGDHVVFLFFPGCSTSF